jgi:DNA-directed RNA polymerase subunit RPC12/RpoP
MCTDPEGLKGFNRGQYFVFVCGKCKAVTQNEYIGKDPIMPQFKSRCPQCGATYLYKLNNMLWEGLPKEPSPRAGAFEEFEIQ